MGEFDATHTPQGEEKAWSGATGLTTALDLYRDDWDKPRVVGLVQRGGKPRAGPPTSTPAVKQLGWDSSIYSWKEGPCRGAPMGTIKRAGYNWTMAKKKKRRGSCRTRRRTAGNRNSSGGGSWAGAGREIKHLLLVSCRITGPRSQWGDGRHRGWKEVKWQGGKLQRRHLRYFQLRKEPGLIDR